MRVTRAFMSTTLAGGGGSDSWKMLNRMTGGGGGTSTAVCTCRASSHTPVSAALVGHRAIEDTYNLLHGVICIVVHVAPIWGLKVSVQLAAQFRTGDVGKGGQLDPTAGIAAVVAANHCAVSSTSAGATACTCASTSACSSSSSAGATTASGGATGGCPSHGNATDSICCRRPIGRDGFQH